ncbi:MAG: hypothetical protein SW833_10735 [Cyanobacteriota bacterium]|nr:hypothetical protein [Cyanobacteriota bacterium]
MTEITYERYQDKYSLKESEMVDVKGRGKMKAHWLRESRKQRLRTR